jgi:serine/threonine protein kinase
MMTPERWQRVKELLGPALELEPSRRTGYLDQACADDASLRGEIELLLAAGKKAGSNFLNDPALTEAFLEDFAARADVWIGRRAGPYEIVEEIGAGGMGEVYRAIRADDQYSKEVAIKLVPGSQGSSFIINRFKNERQILASLEHPNIARLLDGGTTEDGVPYFVMELIEGQRLVEYCDARKLPVSERLSLFLQVCSAVQYAHQRLIIHRDIKPGNILVTAEGVPKLLDFGIAKIVNPNAAADGFEPTITMFRLLTPGYASPEQIKDEAITTASDVYSLGVVLYELLTGHSPYRVTSRTPHEISQAVCGVDPDKPSAAVRQTESAFDKVGEKQIAPAALSEARDASPEKLSKRLSGDLDNIVLMALRKEPQRRYASVEQFAQDIRRHLEHLPVAARKDTLGYRTSKFVVRHKVAVAAAALVTVALLSAMGVTFREARIAQRRFKDVRNLANSLLFDVHDAIRDLPGSTPARKILVDRALQYLDSLAAEAGSDASLLRELATAYERVGEVQGHYLTDNLGETENALRSYQKALRLRESLAAAQPRNWDDQLAQARCHRLVSSQLLATGKTKTAFDNIRAAIAIGEALRKSRPSEIKALDELSYDYEISGHIQGGDSAVDLNDQAGALDSYRKAVTMDQAMLKIDPSSESAQHSLAMNGLFLGDSLLVFGDLQGALQNYQQSLLVAQKIREHSTATRRIRDVAVVYNRIAGLYVSSGEWAAALENNRKALEIYQELVPKDPSNALLRQGLAIAYVNVGHGLGKTRQQSAGEGMIDRGIELMTSIVASNPQNAQQQGILAAMYVSRGENLLRWKKAQKALKEYGAALQIYRKLYAKDASNTASQLDTAACKAAMANTELQIGDFKVASTDFREALSALDPFLSERVPDEQALYTAADSYAGLGEVESKEAYQAAGAGGQKAHWVAARSWYEQSLQQWKKIQHPMYVSPNGFECIPRPVVAQRLAHCNETLRRLGASANAN